MNQLIVEKLFDENSLILEVKEAKFKILPDSLLIKVIFVEDNEFIENENIDFDNLPIDYWFKNITSFLELEIPIDNVDILEKEISINSLMQENDNFTNFYVVETHYPTFNDKIILSKKEEHYYLKWSGFVPDIKNSWVENYMKQFFPFLLQTICKKM